MTLFRPTSPSDFSASDVSSYFANILIEMDWIPFTAAERKLIEEVIFKKYLDTRTRGFFLYHFSPLIENAVRVFFHYPGHPTILELGCGSGSLSILFSLLGAKVIGIDLDPNLISVCRKRQAFYETRVGALDLEFHCGDTFNFPYESIGQVDGIYSLFAFNTMQPSRKLLVRILPVLKKGGKLVISDGNKQSLYNRFFRKRNVLSSSEMQAELVANGWRVLGETFNCAIPPAVVRIRPAFRLALKVESLFESLKMMAWLGVSHTIVAERQGI